MAGAKGVSTFEEVEAVEVDWKRLNDGAAKDRRALLF